MKQFLRSFLTLLLLMMWGSVGFAAAGDNFTLVTAESELKAGDIIIIVNQEEKKALSTKQNTNNRGATLVTISGNTVTSSDETQEITLEGASGAWYFNVGNGYLYADGRKKNNYLKTKIGGKNGDYSKAAIVITSTNTTITFQGDNKNKKLQYNSQNNLFSCYTSGQKAVAIYKKTATKTLTSLAISGEPTKKAYNDGDAFDPTGLVVTGTYDDNTTATITNGITWATTPATLTAGTTSCSVTASVNGVTSPAYNATGLTVTKTISLTIDPATSTVVKAPVKVTLTATPDAGTTIYYTTNGDEPTTTSTKYTAPFEVTKSGTTVKAIAVAEGAEDAKAEATYTIKPDQPVFSNESKTFKDAFDVTLSLPESTDANSTIHYAIGATVTATAKSPLYKGPINISAENEGDKVILHAVVVDQYGNVGMEKYCTYTYELTVVDPNAPLDNIIFDAATKGFDDMIGSNSYPSGTNKADFKTKDDKTYTFSYSNCMRYTNKGYNPDVIQMRFDTKKGMGTITSPVFDKMPNGYKVNVYYGISEGKKPLTITSNEETSATNISNTSGDKNRENGIGYCASIVLANGSSFKVNVGGSTCYVSKIEIIPLSTPITLEEDANDTETKIKANKGKTLDVALTRTLVANKWNTFCVPFETEIAGTALVDATVKTIGTIEGNVINLKDATKIEAGMPYLVMPTSGKIENPTFKGVTITEISAKESGNKEYKFVGTYSPKPITEEEFGTIWGVTAQGKLAMINAKTTMKGLRAYFVFPKNAAAKLNFDVETTGINSIETEAAVNGKVYNLNGQYVGNSLNGLKKGIYVVNGKKVIK